MICAITAIDWNEMEDLLRHGIKTYELVCADHIAVAKKVKKGKQIYLTNLSKQDVEKGTKGILAEVLNIEVGYWRTVPREFDEKELLTARIQVKYLDEVQVVKVKDNGMGNCTEVDVEAHPIFG